MMNLSFSHFLTIFCIMQVFFEIWRMLLANSSVSGKAATGHVLKVRSRFAWGLSGDRSIGGANLRKGHSPFNGWYASCPLQWKRHCRPHWKLALYRLLLLAQKKLYKTFEWDSILTQFSFSRQPSNKTRHVRYRTKSKRDNRKPAQCQ